jgi:hypothetical protein
MPFRLTWERDRAGPRGVSGGMPFRPTWEYDRRLLVLLAPAAPFAAASMLAAAG